MLGFEALKQEIQADIETHRQRLKEHAASSPLAIPIHLALGRLHERARTRAPFLIARRFAQNNARNWRGRIRRQRIEDQ